MALTEYEMAILRTAVEAENQGQDPHDAVARLPHPEGEPDRMLVLSRLNDRYLLDVAVGRGGAGTIFGAHINGVTPSGLDEVRRQDEAAVSVAAMLTDAQFAATEVVVRLIREAIDNDDLQGSPEDRADLQAQLETMEAQRKAPRQRRKVWEALLETTWDVAKSALGSGAFVVVADAIGKVLH